MPDDRTERANRLAAWTFVVSWAGVVLLSIASLFGLVPPKSMRPAIGIWAGGSAVLVVLILVLLGWRERPWWLFLVRGSLIIIGFALGAAALVGIYLAVFDPPPRPLPPEIWSRNLFG